MIHPFARATAVFCGLTAVGLTSDWRYILMVWCLAWIVSIGTHTWREAALFHLVALLPMSIGLALIHASELASGRSALEVLICRRDSIAVVIGRVAVVGLALQTFTLPLLRADALQDALWRLGVRGSTIGLLISAVNAVRDLTRFTAITTDAMRARGLAHGRIIWRIRELPNLMSSVFNHALVAGIARDEMWRHRGIRAELSIKLDSHMWDNAHSWGFAATAVGLLLVMLWLSLT